MPAKNDHSTSIPADILAQAQNLAEQLGTLLHPYVVPLTPSERRALPKMGDKTYAFVEKAHELAKINPALRPTFLDMQAFEIDFADAGNKLEPLLVTLQQLTDNVSDIQMLAGNEAYHAALAFYNYTKVAAGQDVPGAKAVHAALRERFPRTKRRADPEDVG
ncbi:MAG: hypothetical protein LBP86_03135 [Azoarcus sp.]|jgi:hypothetical protein|nr:hypothetical protein [Azoarcus sp.]